MSTEERLERLLTDVLSDGAPSRPPVRLVPETLRAVHDVRRWPRWLALIKEPPMRISSRVAVGSPTARLATILLATLLLAAMATGAVVAGASLLAGPGVIVVAQDGSGSYTTITEAVAAAEDGDTIMVRPGTYVEAVVIEEDITVSGEGPRKSIVIEAPEGGPTSPSGVASELVSADLPYAVLLVDTDATLSGLTLRGVPSAVHARGGAPTLEGLSFEGVGVATRPSNCCGAAGTAVVITEESAATVRDSTFTDGGSIGIFEGSDPLIEGNTLTDGPHIWGNPGQDAVIRGNTISGTFERAMGIYGPPPVGALIEGNTIIVTEGLEIEVGYSTSTGVDPIIRGNTISGATTGVVVAGTGAQPRIEDNELTANGIAMSISGSDALISSNDIHDNIGGILVSNGSPTLDGNTIRGGTTGLVLSGSGATPILSGNTICDNETNLKLSGAEMPATDGDEICPDAPAEASN